MKPATDGAADVSGGAHHSHLGPAQIYAQGGGIDLHLATDHPGGMGVTGGEPLPVEGGGPHLLLLEQLEIFEDD